MTRGQTALLAGVSLAVGFAVAQGTGVRALGGAVLLAALAVCATAWRRRSGTPTAALLCLAYVGAFVLSHVLALGAGVPAWLAVALVAVGDAAVSFAADRGVSRAGGGARVPLR